MRPHKLMRYLPVLIVAIAVLLQGCMSADVAHVLPDEVDFNFHIKPILSNSCYVCHGPDVSTREADLRLDTFEGSTTRREGGRQAIVPGNPYRSILIDRVSSQDPEERMPPAKTNKVLTDYEIALLAKWIDQGAEYKTHWALIPPEVSAIPEEATDVQSIDQFVEEQIQLHQLPMAPEASRESLIRRASYVLTGLPPTPSEVQTFALDPQTLMKKLLINSSPLPIMVNAGHATGWTWCAMLKQKGTSSILLFTGPGNIGII